MRNGYGVKMRNGTDKMRNGQDDKMRHFKLHQIF
jgi:hypothetical protein